MKVSEINNALLPVQKCLAGYDITTLSDIELLSIVLNTGSAEKDVFTLAGEIFYKYNGIHGIYKTGLRELSREKGIGLKKAVKLVAAIELGKRVLSNNEFGHILDSPDKVWKYLLSDFACLKQEQFHVLVLDNKNCVIKNNLISIGTINETIVHPREIFISAIKESGCSIIVCHNHPSGNLYPSKNDEITTKRLADAGKIIGIPLLDHIIITEQGFYSFKQAGKIIEY